MTTVQEQASVCKCCEKTQIIPWDNTHIWTMQFMISKVFVFVCKIKYWRYVAYTSAFSLSDMEHTYQPHISGPPPPPPQLS